MENRYFEYKFKEVLKKLNDIEFVLNELLIVVIMDSCGFINYVNDKFCEIFKYERYEFFGQDYCIINLKYYLSLFFKELWSMIRFGKVWYGEIKNKVKDGLFYWVDIIIVFFLDEWGKLYQYVLICNDIIK